MWTTVLVAWKKSLDLINLCSYKLLHGQEKFTGFSILVNTEGLMLVLENYLAVVHPGLLPSCTLVLF